MYKRFYVRLARNLRIAVAAAKEKLQPPKSGECLTFAGKRKPVLVKIIAFERSGANALAIKN